MEGTTEKLFSQAIKGTWKDGLGEAELMPELEDQSRTRPALRSKGLGL